MDTVRGSFQVLSGYSNIERDLAPPFYRAGGINVPEAQVTQIKAVVKYIQDNTAPEDTIFDTTSQGAYYFFADRPMASKYHQMHYAATPAMQKEVIETLERHKTKLVILVTGSTLERHPLVARYLMENYYDSAEIGNMASLKRGPAPDLAQTTPPDSIHQIDWRFFKIRRLPALQDADVPYGS